MTPAQIAVLLERIDELKSDIAELKALVRITNGRVTELEREQVRREAESKVLAKQHEAEQEKQTNSGARQSRLIALSAVVVSTVVVLADKLLSH